MQFRTVHVGTIDFSAGQKKTLEIPRDGVLTQLNLRLRYDLVNGASGPAGPLFQTLARLIRRADFVLGGRDTVFSQSGEMLAARAQIELGTQPDGLGDTVVLTNSATTSYDVTLQIPRWLPRSNTPMATADDLRRVTQAVLELTFATTADLFTTPDAALAFAAATVDVEAEYLLDVDAGQGFNVRQLAEITEEYTATNDNLGITIDGRTGLVLRSIMLAMLDDDVGSNALLNKLKIQAATHVWHDNRAGALQAMNKSLFAQESIITGVYFRPLTMFGDMRLAIDTGPQVLSADLKAILDVVTGSGVEKIKLSVESVRPLKVA